MRHLRKNDIIIINTVKSVEFWTH